MKTNSVRTDNDIRDGSVDQIVTVPPRHGTSSDVFFDGSKFVVSIVIFPTSRDFYIFSRSRGSDRLCFLDGRRRRDGSYFVRVGEFQVGSCSSDAKRCDGTLEEVLMRSGGHSFDRLWVFGSNWRCEKSEGKRVKSGNRKSGWRTFPLSFYSPRSIRRIGL